MCGINGIIGLDDDMLAKQKIVGMNQALLHRGPDDGGDYWDAENKVALGHRRLSIIDLTEAGHQPMTTSDGRYTIVYNGELYNFKEIKLELQRVPHGEDFDSEQDNIEFRTNTDTEVILAAFIRWGRDCVKRFNGMFAFAIWDKKKKELFIARDRLGIKPLYYYFDKKVLVFSSELRALMASSLFPRKIDQSALADYIRYQTVHAPNTVIRNVFMLLPGHFMSFDLASLQTEKYWSPDAIDYSSLKGKSYKQICADVNMLLQDAVEKRMLSDVPLGAFLSGGIDSSAIVGLMSRIASQPVKTFSVVFDDENFSEAKYAKLIAEKFQTEHHEISLKVDDFREMLPEALAAMDHPSGDGPNTYVVSKVTREAGITVALSGLGGDELFAGYDIFNRSLELETKKWLALLIPQGPRKLAGNLLKSFKHSVASDKIAAIMALEKMDWVNTYPLSRQVLLDEKIKAILTGKELGDNAVEQIVKAFDKKFPANDFLLSRISMAEMTSYMQNVLLRDTDQMSMASALEVRVPFLDHRLVEYTLAVPDKYKRPESPKKLLVDALGDLLPAEIVNRPKMGFTLPWKHWMKNELKGFCETRIQALSKRALFEEQAVLKLWDDFLKNDPRVTWSRIWMLVVLENWLQQNNVEE